jgi:hypothetical protein
MYFDFYIAKLLEEHECVIVPDFGAFISNEKPAYINESDGKIYPASKRLAFNPSLTFNDGLLVNSISFIEKISYNEAVDIVKKAVEQWRNKLQEKETLLMIGIGELFQNDDQKLIFSPLPVNNFHAESFGLHEVEIYAVSRKSAILSTVEKEINYSLAEEESETETEEVQVKHHHKTSKSRKVLYYSLTAYIPIIIGLWAVLFFTDPFNKTNESSFNPIDLKHKDSKEVKNNSARSDIQKTENQPKKLNQQQLASIVDISTGSSGSYYVIGGSFKSYKNAAVLQSEFLAKNFKSRIVKSANKQYRVAYSRFASRSEAERFLQTIRQSENKSAWILTETE